MFCNNICSTYKKSVKLRCQVSHKKSLQKRKEHGIFMLLFVLVSWHLKNGMQNRKQEFYCFDIVGGRGRGEVQLSFVWRNVFSAWTESKKYWIWSVQGDNAIMWSVMWKQSRCVVECLCLHDTGWFDEWPSFPSYLYPQMLSKHTALMEQ
jgi:hypothetical protein